MGYSEDLTKLRVKLQDVVAYDLIEPGDKDFYEATLIQILNEAERKKQACNTQADNLKRQAGVAEGQAAAYGMISSIVYNVVNGYISGARRTKEELAAREAEKKALEEKPVKTTKKKVSKKKTITKTKK